MSRPNTPFSYRPPLEPQMSPKGIMFMLKKYSSKGGADESLARPERKQVTATEDFDVHISYL